MPVVIIIASRMNYRRHNPGRGFSELPRIRSATQRFLDWGGLLSREGREIHGVWRHGWLSGLVFALTIVVYCLNMFGDAMRDLLDPRLRGGES